MAGSPASGSSAPIQREVDSAPDGDVVDEPAIETPVAREAAPSADERAPLEPTAPIAHAPLAGDAPLAPTAPAVGIDSVDGARDDESDASSAIDLPLHVAAAAPAPVQREAEDATETAPVAALAAFTGTHFEGDGHDHSSPASSPATEPASEGPQSEEPLSVAPLLGDRPLQLQRSADHALASPATPAAPTTPHLPLVADVANGPAIEASPRSRPADGQGQAPLAAPVQRNATTPAPTVPPQPMSSSTGGVGAVPAAAAPVSVMALTPRTLPVTAAAGTPPAVQRSASDEAGFLPVHTAAAAQPTAVPVQRATTAPAGTPSTPAMPLQDLARPAPTTPSSDGTSTSSSTMTILREALDNGTGFLDAEGNVVLAGPAAAAMGADGVASVQRQPASTSFVVQRAESSAQPAATAATSADAPAASGDADQQADELADKVYERIRWKLASDIRADERRLGAGHWNRKGR